MSVEQENTPKPMGEDDLPDWLKEIRGQSTTTPKSKTPAESDKALTSDNLPSWLQEAQDDNGFDETEAEDTSQLADEADEVIPDETASDGVPDDDDDDDLRRLLAEEGYEKDALDEDRPAGSEGMSVRDWIAATSTESPLATSNPSAYHTGENAAQEDTESEPESNDDDLPSWLQADSSSSVPETPAWLADETTHDDGDATLEVRSEEANAEEVVSVKDETTSNEDEAVPSWLSAESTLDDVAETPSWLADETTMAEAEADVPASADLAADELVDDDDLPDWLREGSDLSSDLETPAWLADETTHDQGEDTPDEVNTLDVMSAIANPNLDAEADADREDDGIVIEDELPDWLREDVDVEEADVAATASKTPAWLADETTHDDTDEDFDMEVLADTTSTLDDLDVALSSEDDLPDWLNDEQPETEITGELSWLSDDSNDTVDRAIFDDSLMTDIAADEEIDDLLAEVGQDEDDESLPDWLQGSEVDSPDLDLTADEVASTTTSTLEDDIVDIDSLPDWLREEQPNLETDSEKSDEGKADVNIVDTSEPVTANLSEGISEDVPDWLKEEVEEHFSAEDTTLTDEPLAGSEDIEEDADDTTVPPWLEKLRGTQTEASEEMEDELQGLIQAESDTQVKELSQVIPTTANNEAISDKLTVANQTLQAGQLNEALVLYQQLIADSHSLEQVIDVLKENLSTYQTEPAIYEVLGDAHLKLGAHSQALKAYQHALDNL